MCGRFVSARKRAELLEEFAVQRDTVTEDRQPDYNVAPTKRIYTVLDHKDERELRLVRWGLVPSWAKDTKGGARLINARAETVAVKPAFRAAFARRRCLIPADGYYEWQTEAAISRGDSLPASGAASKHRGQLPGIGGSRPQSPPAPPITPGAPDHPRPPYPPAHVRSKGKNIGHAAKQPFYIYRTDGGILAFAGLYELWKNPEVPEDHEDAWYWSATIITTDATDEIGKIHDRTPMVVAPADWAEWLDPANREKDHLPRRMHAAVSSGAGGLTARPVSTSVNSVRNNGPELIEAVLATRGTAFPYGRLPSGIGGSFQASGAPAPDHPRRPQSPRAPPIPRGPQRTPDMGG